MTSTRYCTVERHGRVTLITFQRPEVLNALHGPANHELSHVFDAFEADPEQWVAILTGAGARAFSAGNDLKHQAQVGFLDVPATGMAGLTSRFGMIKPVIAAVNGLALGGGFEIALACDIILAAEHATFALPEPRVGLAALGGGLFRLAASIGLHRAMALTLTSDRIDAGTARSLGIVRDVVAADALLPAAQELAARLCEASPMSIRASKDMILAAAGLDFAAAHRAQAERATILAMWNSADAKEGPRAFAEKRAPVWTGC